MFQGGWSDAFVAKINSAGSQLIYSTYLGGGDGDIGQGIAVDASGNAYVLITTWSTNLPVLNAIQPTSRGGDGELYIAKINSSGSSLVYATYLGGSDSDIGSDISVDNAGQALVTGLTRSSDFPTLNSLQAILGGGTCLEDVPAGPDLQCSMYRCLCNQNQCLGHRTDLFHLSRWARGRRPSQDCRRLFWKRCCGRLYTRCKFSAGIGPTVFQRWKRRYLHHKTER